MASANVYSPDYDSNGNPKPGIPELKDAIENARVEAEDFATATSSFTVDGTTYQKGAKGWATDAEGYKNTAQTEASNAATSASDAADEASDAQKHAQKTSSFTDHDGNAFDQGARGYRDEVTNLAKQDGSESPVVQYESNEGIPFFEILIDGLSDSAGDLIRRTGGLPLEVQSLGGDSVFSVENGTIKVGGHPISTLLNTEEVQKGVDRTHRPIWKGETKYCSFPRSMMAYDGNILTFFSEQEGGHVSPGPLRIIKHTPRGEVLHETKITGPNSDYQIEVSGVNKFTNVQKHIISVRVADRSVSPQNLEPQEVYSSTDDGKTWTKEATLPTSGTDPDGDRAAGDFDWHWPSQTLFLLTGQIDADMHLWESSDRGSTWSLKTRISPTGGNEAEPALAVLDEDSNGNPTDFLIHTRDNDSFGGGHHQYYSSDGGSTWTYAGELPSINKAIRPKLYRHNGAIHALAGQRNGDLSQTIYVLSASLRDVLNNLDDTSVWRRRRTLAHVEGGAAEYGYAEAVFAPEHSYLTFYEDPSGNGKPNIYIRPLNL